MKSPGSLTLALEGSSLSLEKFKQAVTSFLDLVESVGKEAVGEGQRIKWRITVKSGSALVKATPEYTPETSEAARAVITAIPNGIENLAKGIAEPPKLFSLSAIKALRRLATVQELTGNGLTAVRILAPGNKKTISNKVAATVNEIIGTSYEAYGSIEGKLQALWDRGGFKFSVLDALFDRRVDCFVGDDLVDAAIAGFRKRVRVSGTVQYNKAGLPISITATEIYTFKPNDQLPSAADVRGILKN